MGLETLRGNACHGVAKAEWDVSAREIDRPLKRVGAKVWRGFKHR